MKEGDMDKKPIRFRAALAVALSAALFIPLAVFAGSGFARGSASAAQYQYKITICHHAGHRGKMVTIKVSANAWKAHRKHGDAMGACPSAPPRVVAHTVTDEHGKADKTHTRGNAGEHGKSEDHQKANGHKK